MTLKVKTHEMANTEDWWSRVPPLQALALNSVVAEADVDGEKHSLSIRGYAVGSPSGQVHSVDVSIDNGESWKPTEIVYQEGQWSWTLWKAMISLPVGENGLHGEVISRATDVLGHSQQADTEWNLRGVGYSGYGRAGY